MAAVDFPFVAGDIIVCPKGRSWGDDALVFEPGARFEVIEVYDDGMFDCRVDALDELSYNSTGQGKREGEDWYLTKEQWAYLELIVPFVAKPDLPDLTLPEWLQ